MTSVTVVICAYTLERWDQITEAIASCEKQSQPPDEIVLVIDHNEELFERARKEFVGVQVIENRFAKGLSGARNTGVSATTGEVVAFLDDDASAEREWLERLCAPLEDPMVMGVGGWILPRWHGEVASWFPETFYWILGCSYAGLPETGATLRNPIGANMALRRRVFDAVGGFTSGIGRIGKVPLGCEETELCIRYTASHPGERVVLTHDAIVHHVVPPSRLKWHYFRTRCWAEGLSKAAVSSLVGSRNGLSSERRHLLRALPAELGRSIASLPRRPLTATARIVLIVAGTAIAAAGLLRGGAAVRSTPIVPGGDKLGQLTLSKGDVDGVRPSAVGHAD